MKLSTSIEQLLVQLATLPGAENIVVFGSVARQAEEPGDLDVALVVPHCANWDEAVKGYRATIATMRTLSYRYYGAFDPFVLTKSMLVVRNDEATGWKKASNAVALKRAIKAEGKPLLELVQQLDLIQQLGLSSESPSI